MKKIFILFMMLMLICGISFAATKGVVPRADNEGSVGTSAKRWNDGFYVDMDVEGTLTNTGTLDVSSAVVNLAADSVDAITEVAAALKSGNDGTLITGTAGGSGICAEWNADGDVVEAASGQACGAGGGGGGGGTVTIEVDEATVGSGTINLNFPSAVFSVTEGPTNEFTFGIVDDGHSHTGSSISGIDISADTNLSAGTNISLVGDTLNVDDEFLINSGDDSTTGVLTATGFTIGAAAITESELEILDGATITTAELETLSDGSDADTLHVHSGASLNDDVFVLTAGDTMTGSLTLASGQNLFNGANQLTLGDKLDGSQIGDADLGDFTFSSGSATIDANAVSPSKLDEGGDFNFTGTIDASGADIVIPSGTTLPVECVVGELFLDTDADTDGSQYNCVAANTWKEVDDDGAAGGSPGGSDTQIQYNNSSSFDGVSIFTFDKTGTLDMTGTLMASTGTIQIGANRDVTMHYNTNGAVGHFVVGIKAGTAANSGIFSIMDDEDVLDPERVPALQIAQPQLRVWGNDPSSQEDYCGIDAEEGFFCGAGATIWNATSGGTLFRFETEYPTANVGFAFNADQTRDQLLLGSNLAMGRQFIIGNYDSVAANDDFDHAAQTNPTLFIHSDTDPDTANDEWISLTHDQTDAVIATGSGNIKFTGSMDIGIDICAGKTNGGAIVTDANGVLICEDDDGGGSSSGYVILSPGSAFITGTLATVGDATQGAGIDGSNGGVLLFDAGNTPDEGAAWRFRLPDNWASHTDVKLFYSMASGTANEVEWEAAVMCQSDGDAERDDADGFAAIAVASETVPGTIFQPSSVTITLTDDGCAASDLMTLFISTDADDVTNDDATGDRRLLGLVYEYGT